MKCQHFFLGAFRKINDIIRISFSFNHILTFNTTQFLCHCLSQFQNKRDHKATFQNNIHSLSVLERFSRIKTFPTPSHTNTDRKLLLHMSALCTSDACLSLQSRLKRHVLPNDHLLSLSEEPAPPPSCSRRCAHTAAV